MLGNGPYNGYMPELVSETAVLIMIFMLGLPMEQGAAKGRR